ncbi:hypothetical protein IW261DRAFT_1593842 [Armillaria novae-zelandiae]|uniref:Zn(2)-C6 fungal-type domain-containing protein n=1 Tax=Armillaria novae-zelandiae TaxID=153914 RepID=A0AA39P832_9AGAR|nr:hypothetical protein IW261DRAFT_1593842 [Armillaria novae-zelandiae]
MAPHATIPLSAEPSPHSYSSRYSKSASLSPARIPDHESSHWLPPSANITQEGYEPTCDTGPLLMQGRVTDATSTHQRAYPVASLPLRMNFVSDTTPFTRRPVPLTTDSQLHSQIPLTATALAALTSFSPRTEYTMGGNYVSHRDDSERRSWQNHNMIPVPNLVHEYPSHGVSSYRPADTTAQFSQILPESSYPSQIGHMTGPMEASPNTAGDSPSPPAMNLGRRGSSGNNIGPPNKYNNLACYSCRGRKIGCDRPMEGSADMTCYQCATRQLKCEYPMESRRGQRMRSTRKQQVPKFGHDVNFAT